MSVLHSSRPALKSREGQNVEVVRATTAEDSDYDATHPQSLVRFDDGAHMTVWDEEIQEGSAPKKPADAPHPPARGSSK